MKKGKQYIGTLLRWAGKVTPYLYTPVLVLKAAKRPKEQEEPTREEMICAIDKLSEYITDLEKAHSAWNIIRPSIAPWPLFPESEKTMEIVKRVKELKKENELT